MSQYIRQKTKLPFSTGATEAGPIYQKDGSTLNVRYDDCSNWVTIKFDGSLAFRDIPDIAVSEFHLEAYSSICTVGQSAWLNEISRESKESGMELLHEFNHFMIYFDHFCCLEVVALKYTIKSQK